MFGAISNYFRARAQKHDITDNFYETLSAYRSLNSIERLDFETHFAFHWRAFLLNFPNGPSDFANSSRAMQTEYLQKLLRYQNARISESDSIDATTAGLLGLYLGAIQYGNQNLESELARELNSIAQKGWVFSAPLPGSTA